MNRKDYDLPIVNQVMDSPNFASELEKSLHSDKYKNVMSMKEISDVKRIIITGCGDSYMAGIAMKPAVEKLTGLRVDVMRMIEFTRHLDSAELGTSPNNPLVIIISVSGGFARVIEAAKRSVKYGSMTLAITDTPDSPMASECTHVLKIDMPSLEKTAGGNSYLATSTALFLMGLRMGQVLGKVTEAEAADIRSAAFDYCASFSDVLDDVDEQMFKLAHTWKDLKNFDFVGDGADFATAFFGAAKFAEHFGAFCSWDDSEDWCHINFFCRNTDKIGTSIVANPASPSFSRCLETLKGMSLQKRPTLVITTGDKSLFPADVDVVTLPDAKYSYLKPLMQHAPYSILAGYIYALLGVAPFRRDDPTADLGGYNGRNSSEVEIV